MNRYIWIKSKNYKIFLAGHLLHFGKFFHKDVHNLYGLLDMAYTYKALKTRMNKDLPFILSRSTFPGAGKYG